MKISELPEPYRSLAELREMQYHDNNRDRPLIQAFHFDGTPEGVNFWADVLDGKNPEKVTYLLHETMTIEEIKAMPGSYTLPGFTPGNLYAFWDGEEPEEWTVARYSHSERTTPFDRHWTADKRYFAHVGKIPSWSNGAPSACELLAPEEGA